MAGQDSPASAVSRPARPFASIRQARHAPRKRDAQPHPNRLSLRGESFGRALEHFVLGDAEAAVGVKGTSRVNLAVFRALRAFVDDNRPRRTILVCNERAPRLVEGIDILPWREFLARLWSSRVLSYQRQTSRLEAEYKE